MRAMGTTRGRLALAAIAAQPLFVAGWLLADALEEGYSARRQTVSELGAADAAHPWLLWLALAVFGAGYLALAGALAPAVRGRLTPALFAAAGVGTILLGPVRLDCAPNGEASCKARELAGDLSLVHYAHGWLSLLVVVALIATPLALARAQWPGRLAGLMLAAGAAALVLWVVGFVILDPGDGEDGLRQRAGLVLIHGWVIAVAATLLAGARRGEPPAGCP
jgi:hypothetical protein